MQCDHYDVSTLGGFYAALDQLRGKFWWEICNACPYEATAKCMEKGGSYWRVRKESLPMWFRGHTEQHHNLLSTLLRKLQKDDHGVRFEDSYTSTALWGEYREQGFRARTYHRVQTIPETGYDWTAVLRHHQTAATLLDWSESAETALLFALEPFITSKTCCEPAIWVLSPSLLNACVYGKLCQPEPLEHALKAYPHWKSNHEIVTFVEYLNSDDGKAKYFSEALCSYPNINGMISLSVLNAMRLEQGPALFERLKTGEFNPFFWLLLRYYCDGLAAKTEWDIPCVGTIQPYHSKRIQGQRGVFTAFPNYQYKDTKQISDFAMERHADAPRYLAKILLNHPQRIAEQLVQSGATLSGLYQDLDHFSDELERRL